jgi:hypothetical protein
MLLKAKRKNLVDHVATLKVNEKFNTNDILMLKLVT